MQTVLADDPVTLIPQGASLVIQNDEQLDEYTDALFRLTSKSDPTDSEQETIDLLTLLIANQ